METDTTRAYPLLNCVPAVVAEPSSIELMRPETGEAPGLLGAGVASVGDHGRALFVGMRSRDGVTYSAAVPLEQAIEFSRVVLAAVAELAVK